MSLIQSFRLSTPFRLESGDTIDDLTIAYSTFGTLNEERSNVVWAFHALTANSLVTDWWPELFGDGKLFDPKDYFIVCANVIGSPYGTTCPKDLSFPLFTVRDVVKAHLKLKAHLNLNAIQIAIGGSFGGNQALEFAYSLSEKLQHLVLIASSAKESAWGIAIHEAQRMAIQADKTFIDKNGGGDGLKAARAIGMLTYRFDHTFNTFQTDTDEKVTDFKAASYIQYQGEKFNKRFTALSYYYLTRCLDTHNIGRSRGGEVAALNSISAKTLVIGIDSDRLIPTDQQKHLARYINNSIYHEVQSEYGHDGFLIEGQQLSKAIDKFLKGR